MALLQFLQALLQSTGFGFLWAPESWVAWATSIDLPWAVVFFASGVFLYFLGANRLVFRLVLAGLFAGTLYLLSPLIEPFSPTFGGLAQEPLHLAWMGLLIAVIAPVAIFLLFALIGGLIGSSIMEAYPFHYGFIGGGLILGTLSLAFRTATETLISRVVACFLLAIGLAWLANTFGAGNFLRTHPTIFTIIPVVLGLISAIHKLTHHKEH